MMAQFKELQPVIRRSDVQELLHRVHWIPPERR
jgi:hypothetical protein